MKLPRLAATPRARAKYVFILFLIFFFDTPTSAQKISKAEPIRIDLIRDSGYLYINDHVEFIKTNHVVSFDSVRLEKYSSAFAKTSGENVIFIGYDPHYYWFRFEVINQDTVDHVAELFMGQAGMREVEVFQKYDDQWMSLGKTGYKYPFNSRPFSFSHFVYPLTIKSRHTNYFYVRIDETHAFKLVYFGLLHPRTLQQIVDKFYFLFGFMLGVMLLFFLLNLYLFLSTRDTIHGWYSLYVLIQSFLLIKQHGLDAQFLGLDFEAGFRATNMMGIGSLAVGVLIHVIQLFLREINDSKWLGRLTTIIKIEIIAISIIQMIVFYVQPPHTIEYLVFLIVNRSAIIGLIFISITCIYVLLKGNRKALLLTIALLIYLIGGLERSFFLSTAYNLPSILEIGIVLEAVIISFGLMLRYGEYRKEKEELSLQLTTERITQQQKIDTTVKNDRKRIKQDLHDSLGGQLSSISIGLNHLMNRNDRSNLKSIQEIADNALTELRNSLWIMDKEGISIGEIQQRINSLFLQYRKIEVPVDLQLHVDESLIDATLPSSKAGHLYRIIQEATHNSIKHSGASHFKIQLEKTSDSVCLLISDDGIGFDISHEPENGHYGLKNMGHRAEQMNAKLTMEAGEGKGVKILVEIAREEFTTLE